MCAKNFPTIGVQRLNTYGVEKAGVLAFWRSGEAAKLARYVKNALRGSGYTVFSEWPSGHPYRKQRLTRSRKTLTSLRSRATLGENSADVYLPKVTALLTGKTKAKLLLIRCNPRLRQMPDGLTV